MCCPNRQSWGKKRHHLRQMMQSMDWAMMMGTAIDCKRWFLPSMKSILLCFMISPYTIYRWHQFYKATNERDITINWCGLVDWFGLPPVMAWARPRCLVLAWSRVVAPVTGTSSNSRFHRACTQDTRRRYIEIDSPYVIYVPTSPSSMLVYVCVLGYTALNSSKSIGAFGWVIIDCDHQWTPETHPRKARRMHNNRITTYHSLGTSIIIMNWLHPKTKKRAKLRPRLVVYKKTWEFTFRCYNRLLLQMILYRFLRRKTTVFLSLIINLTWCLVTDTKRAN